jgi:hypothetical protein
MDRPHHQTKDLLPTGLRVWLSFLETLRKVSWEEGALIAILWLEVLHPSRPWHPAVLGAALIAYLLAKARAPDGLDHGRIPDPQAILDRRRDTGP